MHVTQWPDTPSWERLVQSSPEATFFHTPQWHEMVHQVYRDYTIATREFRFDDGTRAVVPLIQTKQGGLIRGKSRFKSSVFGGYGGIIAEKTLSSAQQDRIIGYLTGLRASISIDTNPFSPYRLPDTFDRKDDFTQARRLPETPEALLQKLARGARSNLNQAVKKGVTVRTARADQDVAAYYRIYQDTLRRWGDETLFTYPEDFFITVLRHAGPSVKIWLAEAGDRIIAGACIFYWNRIVSYWQGASLQDYFSWYPNNMLHMEIMREAVGRRFAWYDFGPSGGQQGVSRFKKTFGAEKLPFVSGHWRCG